MPQPSITKIRLKITYLKFYPNSSGANELICFVIDHDKIEYKIGIGIAIYAFGNSLDIVCQNQGVGCNIGYLPRTHLKPDSREIYFAHNWFSRLLIASTICTRHGRNAAVLRAKFQNDGINGTYVMDGPDFRKI